MSVTNLLVQRQQRHAQYELRRRHYPEFQQLQDGGVSYTVALRLLRNNHFTEYEALLGADDPAQPMVPTGLATCAVCEGRLLDHRIGQCRPGVYSWL